MFRSSAKMSRSPLQQQQQKETDPNESTYPCQICLVIDNNPIVCCDKCQLWFHFACVNAPQDVDKYDWFCPRCSHQESTTIYMNNQPQNPNVMVEVNTQIPSVIPIPIGTSNPMETMQVSTSQTTDNVNELLIQNISNRSRKSKSATSSSSRRKALAMQKLEEERKLELEERTRREKSNQEYLDKKYSILEQDDETDNENLSYDDEELKFESVKNWAENASKNVPYNDEEIIPQMSSTENNVANHDNQRESIQVPETTIINVESTIRSQLNPKFGQQIPRLVHFDSESQSSEAARFHRIKDNIFLALANYEKNIFPSNDRLSQQDPFEMNTQQLQRDTQTTVNVPREASEIYSSQFNLMNNQMSTSNVQEGLSHDTNQTSTGRQRTSQMEVPQIQSQYSTGLQMGCPLGSQQIGSTQSIEQQSSSTNQAHGIGYQNPPIQTFVSTSQQVIHRNVNQPPVVNNQPLLTGGRTSVANNQPLVANTHTVNSSQTIKVNKPPVMSTSVYQSNIGYQQQRPVLPNYHQHQPIATNYQNRPIVPSYHQYQSVAPNYQHRPMLNVTRLFVLATLY